MNIKIKSLNPALLATLAAALLGLALATACADAREPVPDAAAPWPPAWQQGEQADAADFTPPAFDAPSATDCRRLPVVREQGGEPVGQAGKPMLPLEYARTDARREVATGAVEKAPVAPPSRPMAAMAPAAQPLAEATVRDAATPEALGKVADMLAQTTAAPSRHRPAEPVVTAGVVNDNADFGEYLAYRQRHAGLPVRERDIRERYLLEVTDAQGFPVHDAEVAVQRAGIAQPVMWARTDTAGHVWLHPRAFLAPGVADERTLGVAVRKNGQQALAVLRRGQPQALQLRLGAPPAAQARLDLVFLIDATGSMDDEIAKLKASMRAMAEQIARLPGQPDVCYGLVAYRDRGDAFLTRTQDFTNDLGAFQQGLARLQAGGGGDTPEALNEALHEVVHGLSWRREAARMVVLVADAPPHLDYQGPQYDRDMQAALAKGIKLFAVGASGLDPVGEYIFRQMAQYTAGRFVFLTYRDASDPGSGPGTQTVHDVQQYSVQTLDRLVVRLVGEEMAKLKRG
ncbi:MAG TPA: vWA domain-containing protein [Ideonella sp.]|uniref:vWA domain-containing protein n=1 Tax=Ideonella sp. TaxID=1929293 RepID=UPI002C05D66F|nr:vWA domain-containing protein [Ideonella sp.]HSI48786.1 vWA domain-containing protein [Ideonella sp.]